MLDTPRSAIVLLSGGLDSATCLAIARAEGFSPIYTLAFDYGQRHRHELTAAQHLARLYRVVEHRVIHIDLRQFGHSALTADIPVPKDRPELLPQPPVTELPNVHSPAALLHHPTPVPITYVPARNTIFLSYALALAEVRGCHDLFLGVNAIDYSGYPDCRPEFIEAFERMANLATAMTAPTPAPDAAHPTPHPRLKIHTPLVHLTKAEIIRKGAELGVDYALTHSCYDPTHAGLACGHCDACLLRKKGFADAGLPDPTRYA